MRRPRRLGGAGTWTVGPGVATDKLLAGDVAATTGTKDKQTATTDLSDGSITTRIESKYFIDGDVHASRIAVNTRDAVVTLSGTVPSKEAKDAAVQLARDTDGVRQVRDRLKVDTTTTTTSRD